MHVFGVRWVRHDNCYTYNVSQTHTHTHGHMYGIIYIQWRQVHGNTSQGREARDLGAVSALSGWHLQQQTKGWWGSPEEDVTSSEKRNREKKTHQMLNLVSVS